MTDTKTNEDLREKILAKVSCKDINDIRIGHEVEMIRPSEVYEAMDEYFTIRAKELLEWMAKKDVICSGLKKGLDNFEYKGEWITTDALFENFL